MAIDLSNYEDVATMNKWFQNNYPMGACRVLEFNHKFVEVDGLVVDEIFTCVVGVYRDNVDELPAVSNVARGRQSEYPKHMQRFFVEDVVTSGYGRCFTLLKGSEKTASKQEMQKVVMGNAEPIKPMYGKVGSKSAAIEMALRTDIKNNPWSAPEAKAEPEQWSVNEVAQALNATVVDQTYECQHGAMIRKEGTSQAGKPYYGFVCVEKRKADQCAPVWGRLTANGKWSFGEQDK
jgi:hypothetical protein